MFYFGSKETCMSKNRCYSLFTVALRSNVYRAIFALIVTLLLGLGAASPGHALPAPHAGSLSVVSASAAAGSNVDLAVNLSSGAGNVCTLQFDLQFSSALSYVSTATGAAATAASKTASGGSISGGSRVLVFNLNRNVIGAGAVAVVTVAIAPGTPAGAIPVTLGNITASDPDGLAISVSNVNGTVTVSGPSDTTPPTISGVTSSSITTSGATITWTTNEPADSQVEYGTTTAYGSSTTLNSSLVTSHSQALTGLAAGTLYHYRVKSKDAANNLATSPDYTFTTTTPVDTTPPSITAVSSSGITGTTATITWTTNEAADTQVEYGPTTSYGSSTVLNSSMVTSHVQALAGLSANTLYHYRVKSKDAATNLATSPDYNFTTTAQPDITAPVISAVSASGITSSGASITWATDEAADSQVEYGTTTSYGSSTVLNGSMSTSHAQALNGLAAGTTYHFRVKSKDAAANPAVSGDFTFKTLDPPDTTAPVISAVVVTGITTSGATITWTTDEAADSQVEYGPNTNYGSATTLNGSMVTSHSQTLSGLAESTTYHFRIKSRDVASNLTVSGDFSFKTSDPVDTKLPVITGVGSSAVSSSTAMITWTTDEPADSQVNFGPNTFYGSSTTLATSMVTTHEQQLSGLSASTTYHYRVLSKDAAGNLAISGDYTFTTPVASDTTPPLFGDIAVINVTVSGATITWTTNEAADTQVDFGITPLYGNSTTLDATLATSHAQALSGLTASTTYHFRVKSRDADGNLGISGDHIFTTLDPPDSRPPAITGITISDVTSSGATITWTTSEAADAQIEFGPTAAYGSFTPRDATRGTGHTLTLSDLAPSTTYHFRILARDAADNLGTSDDYSFTTAPIVDIAAPVISAVTAFNVTNVGATITWATDEAADAQVEFGVSPAYGNATPLDVNLALSHTLTLTDLAPGITYHFRVRSSDASGNIAVSDDFTFTTTNPADVTPPVILDIVVSGNSTSGAIVSWLTDEASTSQVEYGTTTEYGNLTTLDANLVTLRAQTLSGLLAGTTYHFRIHSTDGAGNEVVSEDRTFATVAEPDTTPPVISFVMSGNVSNRGATITWTTNEAADTQVEYGPTSDYGSLTTLDAVPVTSHSQNLSGLAAGTLYHFRVLSSDDSGNVSASDDFTFTTDTVDAMWPVLSAITASGITHVSATISWTTDELSDSQVAYGTGEYSIASPLDTNMVTSHVFVLEGLTPKTQYSYRVISRDAAGNLGVSDYFTFATAEVPDTTAPAITNVMLAGVTHVSAYITWATDEPADSRIEFGTTTEYGGTSLFDPALVTMHAQVIAGLLPSTMYHYRVLSRDAAGNLAVSGDCTFTSALLPDTTPPIISGVAITRSSTTATITFTTNEETSDGIEYGITTAYGTSTPLDPAMLKSHSVRLEGLAPETTYFFRIVACDMQGNVIVSTDYSFTTKPLTRIKLAYPRLANTTGETTAMAGGIPVDRTEYTGLTIANLGKMDAFLTFTAYGQNGAVLAGAGILNPAERIVPAGAQQAFLGQDLFGTLLADHSAVGWVEVESSVEAVTGIALVFDAHQTEIDGVPLVVSTAKRLVFPEIERLGYTHLHLANPNEQPANVTFELRAAFGSLLNSASRRIEAKGAMSESIATLFPWIIVESDCYVQATSDVGLVALEMVGRPARDFAGFNAIDAAAGATTLYAPHYSTAGTSRSTLSIANLDETEGQVTLQLFGDDGVQIGPTRAMSIAGNGKVFVDSQTLFRPEEAGLTEGYLVVKSATQKMVGDILFSDKAETGFAAALPLVGQLEKLLTFSQIASDETYFTNLSLLNPSPESATVTIDLYYADGTLESSAAATLSARTRLSQQLTAIFPQLAGQTRTSGYIQVTSDKDIAGFTTVGTRDQKSLSALPAQVLIKR
jgi:type VI protein secretion system component Hcp